MTCHVGDTSRVGRGCVAERIGGAFASGVVVRFRFGPKILTRRAKLGRASRRFRAWVRTRSHDGEPVAVNELLGARIRPFHHLCRPPAARSGEPHEEKRRSLWCTWLGSFQVFGCQINQSGVDDRLQVPDGFATIMSATLTRAMRRAPSPRQSHSSPPLPLMDSTSISKRSVPPGGIPQAGNPPAP